MFRRADVLLAAAGAALIAPVTGALATVRVSAPPPPLASLVLAPVDLQPGAVVASQVTTKLVGGRQILVRVFKPGARISTAPLLGAVSAALLEPDASTAVTDYTALNGEAQSKRGRQALAKEWAIDFVKGINAGSHGKAKLDGRTGGRRRPGRNRDDDASAAADIQDQSRHDQNVPRSRADRSDRHGPRADGLVQPPSSAPATRRRRSPRSSNI